MGVTYTSATAPTYVPIFTTTLASANTVGCDFTSIPSTYTDLVLVTTATRTDAGSASGFLRVTCNNDTGANYSNTYFYGTGSTYNADKNISNSTGMATGIAGQASSPGSISVINIMNYSNSTTYKTSICKDVALLAAEVDFIVANWWNTAAINRLTVTLNGVITFAAGSTFTLYGIKAA